MFGAIAGAISAVISGKNAEYAKLKKEYKEDVIQEVLIKYHQIIMSELDDTTKDIMVACNVEKKAFDEVFDTVNLKLKAKTADMLIGKLKRRLLELTIN